MRNSEYLTNSQVKSIKKQLIDLDLTITQLAKELGCDRANISMIFNQKRKLTPMLAFKLNKLGIYFDE